MQLLVEGTLARHQGRWNEAESKFQQALARVRAMPWPPGEARTLRDYGVLLARTGDRDQGRKHLEEALVIYRWMGAHSLVASVTRTLEELTY